MTKRLSVLYVSNLYPPHVVGGAELIAAYLAEAVADAGHHAAVVATQGPGAARSISRDLVGGVEVTRFFPRNTYWIYETRERSFGRKLRWHLRDAFNLHALRVFRRVVGGLNPDIVHTHNIDGFSPAVWRVAQEQGLPIVHTAHDFHLVCPRATLLRTSGENCRSAPLPCRVYRRWYAAHAAGVDAFCSPSRFLLEEHRTLGIRARSHRVVLNGIPAGAVSGRSSVDSTEALRVLYMGQLALHKGVAVLLEAFSRLERSLPVTLHVAGRGPLASAVTDAARQDPRIRVHGFVDGEAKAQLLRDCQVLVLPSLWYENAPVSVIEALTAGSCVVASDIGGLPEYVPTEAGFLTPPGDAGALAARLRQLATEPGPLAQRRAGALAIAARHTSQQMAAGYLDLYRELLG